MQKQARIKWIDVAKGILIVFVVLQHLPIIAEVSGISHGGVGVIGKASFLFGSFYMQAFFIITGYCSNFHKSFKDIFVTSIKTILIPAFFFSIFYYLALAILYSDLNYLEEIIEWDYLILGFKKFWFLDALFLLRITYWFRVQYVKDDIIGGGDIFNVTNIRCIYV